MSYHHTPTSWTGAPVGGSRLSRLLRDILAGLDALHRAQFESPWTAGAARRGRR